MGPCCEQTHAAFEVGLSLDQGQGVYSGWPDVDGSSQLRLCHTCIIDVMYGYINNLIMDIHNCKQISKEAAIMDIHN